jgi:5-methylcytosine-specific restriction protein A
LQEGERKDIILEHNKIQYQAYIEMESTDTSRTRMFWKSDFSWLLKKSLPKWYDFFSQEAIDEDIDTEEFPKIRFYKDASEDNQYKVEFINPDTIYNDILKAESEAYQVREEGGVKFYLVKKYERDPINRKNALEIHGMSCVICGFNFADIYGELGEGFIEVHHVEPLSESIEEHPIDPRTDLFPICPNCHAMIHRGNEVLSIEQLKKIIQKNRKQNHTK